MGQHLNRVLQRLAPEQGNELLEDCRRDHRSPGHQTVDFVQQTEDPRNVIRRSAEGQLIAADVEVNAGKLVLDETQGFVVAAE